MKSDVELKKDVMDELAWDPHVNEVLVGVEVKNGIVTLSGHLGSYGEKLAAERAALRVAGVKAVTVELDVRLQDPHQRTDADIASAANTILSWNSAVPLDAVKVMVEDGVITLSGEVHGDYQRRAAERAVRMLMGVKEVRNIMTVKPVGTPKDLKSKITAALHRQAQLDAQTISVTVDGDHITLNGTVASWSERRAALHAVASAPGVAEVIDKLDVVE